MIVDSDGNIIIVTQKNASMITLVNTIEQDYNAYKNYHLIVNLSRLDEMHLNDIINFLSLSNNHRKNKKSFVIVTSKIDLDQIIDEIVVVPTMQEAYDIIEMEDIERNLGF